TPKTATTPTFPTPASAQTHSTGASTTPTKPATSTPTPVTATTAPKSVAPPTAVPTTPTAPKTTVPTTPTTSVPTTAIPGGSAVKPLDSGAANARARTRAHSRRSGKISTEAVVLAAIAALLLLACAVWAFARSRASEPHWLVSLRHAMSEAGFRTSATWAEFTDWVRLGR